MKKMAYLIGLAMLGTFGGIALTAGNASAAAAACYQLSNFTAERVVLSVLPSGSLGSGQKAFRLNGKHVGTCGVGSMVPVFGTVVTGTGAHLSMQGGTVRAACTALNWECTTDSTSASPNSWSCHFQPEGSTTISTFTLNKVASDATCAVFQDGAVVPATPEILGGDPGVASGLNQ